VSLTKHHLCANSANRYCKIFRRGRRIFHPGSWPWLGARFPPLGALRENARWLQAFSFRPMLQTAIRKWLEGQKEFCHPTWVGYLHPRTQCAVETRMLA